MELLQSAAEMLLHLDRHLADIVGRHGAWTYALLLAIVFAETGLVVMPLLPGDSLLFAAGALAGAGALNLAALLAGLTAAAILGDFVNYHVGRRVGLRVFRPGARVLKPAHLERTRRFYDRHGGTAIVLARFVPIVRTFAPFVAGACAMEYRAFARYNVAGAVLWVFSMTLAGFAFGGLPVVRDHFGAVVLGIIAVSLLPAAAQAAAGIRARTRNAGAAR